MQSQNTQPLSGSVPAVPAPTVEQMPYAIRDAIRDLTNSRPIQPFTVAVDKPNEYSELWRITVSINPNSLHASTIDVSRFPNLSRVAVLQQLDNSLALELHFVIVEKEKHLSY